MVVPPWPWGQASRQGAAAFRSCWHQCRPRLKEAGRIKGQELLRHVRHAASSTTKRHGYGDDGCPLCQDDNHIAVTDRHFSRLMLHMAEAFITYPTTIAVEEEVDSRQHSGSCHWRKAEVNGAAAEASRPPTRSSPPSSATSTTKNHQKPHKVALASAAAFPTKKTAIAACFHFFDAAAFSELWRWFPSGSSPVFPLV